MSAHTTLYKQSTKISPELFAPYLEAAGLLEDNNLIWDKDFDMIRVPLALSLRESAATHNLNPWFLEVAYRLIDTTRANA